MKATLLRPISMCATCHARFFALRPRRSFTTLRSSKVQEDGTDIFAKALEKNVEQARPASALLSSRLGDVGANARRSIQASTTTAVSIEEPYHLNVYAHRHNMHITFTAPDRNPILSLSAGNIGLKKAQRSTFDAAYQLAVYTMGKLLQIQWRIGGKKKTTEKLQRIQNVARIEVILRGFGAGREAFQKALLGPEGRIIKPKVVKVTDSTRLKFGGVKSKNVRRLG